MTDQLTMAATLVAAIGCGLMAGLLFAFSAFLMKALGRLPASQGLAAMQSINTAILTPVFLLLLFGTTVLCALLAVTAPFAVGQPGAIWRLAGSLLFVVGVFLVTAAANVPLNNTLAKVAPDSQEGAQLWGRYLTRWTAWNHVRTLAATGAATMLTVALLG